MGYESASPSYLARQNCRSYRLTFANIRWIKVPQVVAALQQAICAMSLSSLAHRTKIAAVCTAVAVSVGTTGCTSGPPVISAGQVNQELAGGYKLGVGDRLRVTVFDEPTLTGEYLVGASGAISLPLIAEVPAARSTPEELAKVITARLEQGGYLITPRVAVDVLNHRPFFILGEVNKPGEYPYSGDLTLLQAIARAGGFTARANKTSVVIRRPEWESARTVKLNEVPLLIAPGDTVTISEAFF